jgi:hypothetical protein
LSQSERLRAAAEAQDAIEAAIWTPPERPPQQEIPCYDPGTMQFLGTLPAMPAEEARLLQCPVTLS